MIRLRRIIQKRKILVKSPYNVHGRFKIYYQKYTTEVLLKAKNSNCETYFLTAGWLNSALIYTESLIAYVYPLYLAPGSFSPNSSRLDRAIIFLNVTQTVF